MSRWEGGHERHRAAHMRRTIQPVGVLNGQYRKTIGRMVSKTASRRKTPIAVLTTMATLRSTVQRNTTRPTKKMMRLIWSIRAIDAMIDEVCHWDHASCRSVRSLRFVCAIFSLEYHLRYSLHHCFALIPSNAAESVIIRLVNHRALMTIDVVGASDDKDEGNLAAVDPRKGGWSPEGSPTRNAMSERSWTVVSELSVCRLLYNSTTNVVSTEENSPAWRIRAGQQDL